MNRFGKPEKKDVKIKSILKGFPSDDDPIRPDPKDNPSSVAVTINNFMHTDKKIEQPAQTYNTRPYSSDNKDREKKANPYDLKANKLFAFDNSINSNIKAAYDHKIVGKIGVTTPSTIKNIKKEEVSRKGVLANDRPQSANIVGDRKKGKNVYPYPGEELMINNIGKKRYPSSNARDEVIRLK